MANNSRRMRWARMGEMRKVYKILVRKTEEKISLGRLKRRWEDNIRVDLRGIGWVIWLRILNSGWPL